mmetsp:Transcript_24143/g.83820  ORF Transcript_24143/g.83820 Transcript_24143/m.83820 type:complete len:200 (-) Transcript_24143:2220-2819(-)
MRRLSRSASHGLCPSSKVCKSLSAASALEFTTLGFRANNNKTVANTASTSGSGGSSARAFASNSRSRGVRARSNPTPCTSCEKCATLRTLELTPMRPAAGDLTSLTPPRACSFLRALVTRSRPRADSHIASMVAPGLWHSCTLPTKLSASMSMISVRRLNGTLSSDFPTRRCRKYGSRMWRRACAHVMSASLSVSPWIT